MSIPVALDDLAATLAGYPWGYLVTVGPDARAHLLAVPTDWREGALHADAGRTSRNNATAQPEVSIVFPGADGTAYSLIVDGTATVTDLEVVVTPSHAILHRPALKD